jgi:protein SCO1/2
MKKVWLIVALAACSALAQDAKRNVLALETGWRTEAGAQTTLGAWKGKPFVLAFVYTSCPGTCPLTTAKLKRLDAELKKAKALLDVVVVSLDPTHDTPEAVRAYRARYKLEDARRWQVLVGDEATLRSVTMLADFRYSRNAETGAIDHDNAIFLVDREGGVAAQMSSIDQPLQTFVAAATQLAR